MPQNEFYNHRQKSTYKIDFERWIQPFNNRSIFFQNWYKHLLIASNQMKYRSSTDDCFNYAYTSNGVPLLINFNIGHIYSQCEKHRLLLLHKEKVSLDKFGIYGNPCEYAYHPVMNWKFPAHAVSDFPVLCCYAPVQENNQIVP